MRFMALFACSVTGYASAEYMNSAGPCPNEHSNQPRPKNQKQNQAFEAIPLFDQPAIRN